MIEILNVSISAVALIVAFATAFFAHHYYTKGEQERKRETLISTLQSIDEFKVLFHGVARERKKTGVPLGQYEIDLFALFESNEPVVSEMERMIQHLLDRHMKIPNDVAAQAQIVKVHTNRLTNWMNMIHARFVNFNNNRIHEMESEFKRISALAKHLSNTASKP